MKTKKKVTTVTFYSRVMDMAKKVNGSTDWLIMLPKHEAIKVLIGFANEVLSGLGDVSLDASSKIATAVYADL